MFGYDRLLAMNTGVEGGETALKLARSIELIFGTVSLQGFDSSQKTVVRTSQKFPLDISMLYLQRL